MVETCNGLMAPVDTDYFRFARDPTGIRAQPAQAKLERARSVFARISPGTYFTSTFTRIQG